MNILEKHRRKLINIKQEKESIDDFLSGVFLGNELTELFEELDEKAVKVYKTTFEKFKILVIAQDKSHKLGTISKLGGEKICKAFQYARRHRLPIISFSASGGVRVQEGVPGLIQMATITDELEKFKQKRMPYISVLMNPTYGGTTASFALQGDINIAEKSAKIGFGGKKLIKNILHEKLPENFQTAEYMYNHGMIDVICERNEIRENLSDALNLLYLKTRIPTHDRPEEGEERKTESLCIKKSRSNSETNDDYIRALFSKILFIAGDRISEDDKSIECGVGFMDDKNVAFISQCRGRDLKEAKTKNFGMTSPSGIRKAIRIAKLAERFKLPLLILEDSPGAHPGVKSEETGISVAIETSIREFIKIKTKVIAIITGEACSGGALSLSISDRLAMFDTAFFSVISPESYAEITHREVDKKLLSEMEFTGKDLLEKGIIDCCLKTGNFDYNVKQIKNYFFSNLSKPYLRYNRIRKWRK